MPVRTPGTRAELVRVSRTHHPAGRRRPTPPPDPDPARGGYVLLLTIVMFLTAFGLVMVLSASNVQAIRDQGTPWAYFRRQVLWVALGGAMMAGTLRLDYRVWRKLGAPVLGLAMALMVLVLVPGIGTDVYGSSRWLRAGPFSMQPSELAKLGLVIFGAELLARRTGRMGDLRATLWPVLIVLGVLAALVMKQPDMGTTMVLSLIVVALLFVGGTPLVALAKLLAGGAALSVLMARIEPYRWARVLSFRDPFADADNTGYQLAQSLVGLGSGGLFGVGLGASRAKWGFLPNAHTDFIFAIIGEELGLIGSLLVVLLFGGFAVLGVRAALRAPDRFGMLLAAGITAWIVGQAFINMGVVVGMLPVTGVPLPFVSAGGSSMVIAMGATGILLNVARQPRAVSAP